MGGDGGGSEDHDCFVKSDVDEEGVSGVQRAVGRVGGGGARGWGRGIVREGEGMRG